MFDATEDVFQRLGAPSDPACQFIYEFIDGFEQVEDEPVTEEAKKMLQFSVTRGYAMRLAETDEAPNGAIGEELDPSEAIEDLVLTRQVWDMDEFWAYFVPGEKVWKALAQGWTRMVNLMLSKSPGEPRFPIEPIDQAMRMGYLIAIVDQSFGLGPAWR